MIIKYKTNAEKAREMNEAAYKRRPVYKNARKAKKEAKANEGKDVFADVDFKMF